MFDASLVSYNGISLNGCHESGPSFNPPLVEVLMRFGNRRVTLTRDRIKFPLDLREKRGQTFTDSFGIALAMYLQ